MTWIVARSIFTGNVLVISDTQVTFVDKKSGQEYYEDCLQKIQQVDSNLVIGFSGNVYGGLEIIDEFSSFVRKEKVRLNKTLLEPQEIINSSAGIIKSFYEQLPGVEKESGVELIIAGVSPNKGMGVPGWGRPYLAILKYPDFKPRFSKMNKSVSIGKGSAVSEYKMILNKVSGQRIWGFEKLESKIQGGYAAGIAAKIITEIQKTKSVDGVSKNFHVMIVSRQGVKGVRSGNSSDALGKESNGYTKNLSEFKDFINNKFKSTMLAIANRNG